MKLNPDCVRDTLLYLEENLKVELDNHNFNTITLRQLRDTSELNSKYSQEDIWYTIYNLKEIRFIEGRISDVGRDKMMFCEIQNITWNGHQFLNTIRPKSIWDATKDKAKQIGGMSLHSLSMISSAIMQGLASNPDFIQSIVEKIT